MDGIRIDELPTADVASRDHVVAAMLSGLSKGLTVGQILDLVVGSAEVSGKLAKDQNLGDLLDAAASRANLGADDASNLTKGTQPKFRFPLAGGLGNALTLTPTVPLTAYTDGDVVTFTAASNNTAAAILNVSGVGDKAIRKIVSGADAALDAKDMRAGRPYTAVYDSSANSSAGGWILVNPSSLDTWSEQAAISIAAKLNTADLPTQSSVAKAWAIVSAGGTIAKSFNITSVAKTSTGRWRVTIEHDMDSSSYTVVGSAISTNAAIFMADPGSFTAARFDCSVVNNSNSYADPTYIMFAIFGDLT